MAARIENVEDHIDPEDPAYRLTRGDENLTVVDIRPKGEYARFHLRGALNIPISDLHRALRRFKGLGDIVLYSNGMTHPAQPRDSLERSGFRNVYMLTGGLDGFNRRCLMPISLRDEPVPEPFAGWIRAWRAFFLSGAS